MIPVIVLATHLQDRDIHDKFIQYIDRQIVVLKQNTSFEQALMGKVHDFLKTNKRMDQNDLVVEHLFRVRNSRAFMFSFGAFPESDGTFVAWPTKGKYEIQEVMLFDRFRPMNGIMSNGRIVVSGREFYDSNYAHPAVVTYRHVGEHWDITSAQVGNFEGGVGPFHLSRGQWSAFATGRTYPKNIDVPHGAANVEMARPFVVSDGDLVTSKDRFVPCAMKTMDDMIGAVQAKKWPLVRHFSASDSMFERLRKLTVDAPKVPWRILNEMGEKTCVTKIPKKNLAAVVGKVGRIWKLIKIVKAPAWARDE